MGEVLIRAAVSDAARKLARLAKGCALAATFFAMPDGKRGVAWAIDKASDEDVEMVVVGLLDRLSERAAQGAAGCPDCAARLDRTIAALGSLGARDTAPAHGHLH